MKKKISFYAGLFLCIWMLCSMTGMAASKTGFVTYKTGNTVYLKNGRRLKGFQTIKGKKYYFDAKGILKKNCWFQDNGYWYRADEKGRIQKGLWTDKKDRVFYLDKTGKRKSGWQKINEKYYFFSLSSGVMQKNKTVDGIRLQKNGKAKVTSKNSKTLMTYVLAQQVVEQVTTPTMSKAQKLRACFTWVVAKPYKTIRYPFKEYQGWAEDYANDIFIRGGGTCYSDGAAVAFLANALGYKDVCVSSSGGHGWAEINGMVYDPLLWESQKDERYFGQIRAGGTFKAYYQVRIK